MRGDITTETTEMQKIPFYYTQRNQMTQNKFWKHKLPRLNHEGRIVNRPLSQQIEEVIKKEIPGPDGFTGELYQAFKQELKPIPLKFFPKRGENIYKLI